MLAAAKKAGVPETFIHFFGDGRDTSPRSALTYLDRLREYCEGELGGYGELCTVVGRYYAMDRDKRWEVRKSKMCCVFFCQFFGCLIIL